MPTNALNVKPIKIMEIDLDVQYASAASELPDVDMLALWVNAVLQSKQWEKSPSMTIRIVDEPEAIQLNETWRQSSGPTNILSFPFELPPGVDLLLLGDIVICAPLVAYEATEQHKSRNAHWAHLVIHGTLHLLGYDHIVESQTQIMENIEISILHELGYPNPYLL